MGVASDDSCFIWVYGLAHFGKSLFWHASELLFAFFLTEACGLPPHQMALILSGSLVLNAAADVVVGRYLSYRVETAVAAGRTQFRAALFSVSAFCAFGCAGLVPAPARFGFAIVSIIAFRLSYPFFDIPQNALLALTTSNDDERARLSSYRFIFGGVANIVLASSFGPLLQGQLAGAQAINFAVISLASSVVALGASAALLLFLKYRANSTVEPTRERSVAFHTTLAPGSRIALLFAMILVAAATGSAFARLQPYLAAYATRPVGVSGGMILIGIALGNVASQPLWAWTAQRLSLLVTLRIAASVLTIASALFYFAVSHSEVLGTVTGALTGAGAGGMNMCLWALIATATRRTRWLGATSAFGLATALAKLGSAVAVLCIGELLASNDYRNVLAWRESLLFIMAAALIACGLFCTVSSYLVAQRLEPDPHLTGGGNRIDAAVGSE
jgi:GPH family glycoside/pentoside/hexuronide:cation symporter